ncbi:ATP-binding cassette domain-containing protein [Trinickia mobilis]|uniref:ATP-binding cassette domain-containing protein n=1 Tax=Trinickia mobilis TaxID=2816356 RepID=UPI001A8EA4AC|nr:ABC transporter ATP-binding protein [Trinickia mobilis]
MQFIRELLTDYITAYRTAVKNYKALPVHFVASTLFMLAVTGLDALVPYLLREATNALSAGEHRHAITAILLAGAYGLCWTAARVSEWIKTMVSAIPLTRCDASFQRALYSHLIRVEYGRLAAIDPGSIASIVARSRTAFSTITFTLLWVVVPTLFQLGLASAVVWRFTEGYFAVAFAISMLVLFVSTWWLASRSKNAHQDVFSAENALSSHLVEKLSFLLDIKLNNAYDREDSALSAILREYVTKASRANSRMALLLAAQALCTGIVLTAFTVMTAAKVTDASFQVGDFVMIVGYIVTLTAPFTMLSATLSELRGNHVALRDGFEILGLPLESGDSTAVFVRSTGLVCDIENADLVVGSRVILKDVCFRAARNKLTVLIGPSGSGKSSLINLILGLIRPSRGKVSVLGANTRNVASSVIARELAVAPQNPLIVSGTLRDNLAYGCDDTPDDRLLLEIVDELELADLGKECTPNVLDQDLGVQGRELSGGERQRIALGRALARRPSILILDEPTSSIDPAREARIIERVRVRVPTIIAVTHRDALLRVADRIYQVGDSRVRLVARPPAEIPN